jgi:hypothetical protein
MWSLEGAGIPTGSPQSSWGVPFHAQLKSSASYDILNLPVNSHSFVQAVPNGRNQQAENSEAESLLQS